MSQSEQNLQYESNWLYAFWKFSRPHTIFGTSLSVLGVYLITLHSPLPHLWQLLGTWIACLLGNVYIVGLNQLEDIEIDQINKPHLPLAAGDFSLRTGQWIVAVCGIGSLLLASALGPYLLGMVLISLAIGTAYSLPPIRLKRFPFWAALCIFSVRGAVVNLGLYLHFHWLTQQVFSIPREVWALTLFVIVFSVAIAIVKDIPDMEGDRLYNITTLTLKIGQPAVLNVARGVLTVCYVGMILAGWLWLSSVNSVFLGLTHTGALLLMWWQSLRVDFQDKDAIVNFYQFIWKLFFLEYLIFPAACLLVPV